MLIDPNLGKKNSDQNDVDTYCDVTGFTRSNGEKPTTESICKVLNEKSVSFAGNHKPINMNGHNIKNVSNTLEQDSIVTMGHAAAFLLVNSIDSSTLPPGGIITINSSGNGLTTEGINEIKSKAEKLLIL